jgi:hypothetical protein
MKYGANREKCYLFDTYGVDYQGKDELGQNVFKSRRQVRNDSRRFR